MKFNLKNVHDKILVRNNLAINLIMTKCANMGIILIKTVILKTGTKTDKNCCINAKHISIIKLRVVEQDLQIIGRGQFMCFSMKCKIFYGSDYSHPRQKLFYITF
jgi:hypothetical protein